MNEPEFYSDSKSVEISGKELIKRYLPKSLASFA
jgi:hypothetical protein